MSESIHEYLGRPCVVVAPGGSPLEDTIKVPPGKEMISITEVIKREEIREPAYLEDAKQQARARMAHRIAAYILEHYDPVLFERFPDGSMRALLQIQLRVLNTVDNIARAHQEQGHKDGLVEGAEQERERNRKQLMRYLANEGLL